MSQVNGIRDGEYREMPANVIKQNGEYYHTWIVDKDNIDEPIMLYYNIANPENFILVGLGIVGVVTIILIAIGAVLEKRKLKIKKEDE